MLWTKEFNRNLNIHSMSIARKIVLATCMAITILGYAKGTDLKEIRTYLSFSMPIDPVKIITIPDMDVSYALGATLVAWDKDKQIAGASASSWSLIGVSVARFKIRSGLKWSNGTLLTPAEIKNSFETAFKKYPEDLRSLKNIVDRIEAGSDHVDFHLSSKNSLAVLLGKLTEPNYGIFSYKKSGEIDLSKTLGAFFVSTASKNEILLRKNPHWYSANPQMADQVIIRKPNARSLPDNRTLLDDPWPNLIETNSLVQADLQANYEKNRFEIWQRPPDKVYHIHMSKAFADSGGARVLRLLNETLDRSSITKGLSGWLPATQMFPVGYQLFDENFSKLKPSASSTEKYSKSLRVLLIPSRSNSDLQKNLALTIEKALGNPPQIIETTLDKFGEHNKKGDYDVFVGTLGLADPDPEGAMSYYFEGPHAPIQSGKEDFLKTLDGARKIEDRQKRLVALRKLLSEATMKGHILPLFHLSTVGVGRQELDFSQVPKSDESVTLSKIRFKGTTNQ